jgi:hypothetical protein
MLEESEGSNYLFEIKVALDKRGSIKKRLSDRVV